MANRPFVDGPDIVVVSLDTVRADHLGAWGHPKAWTPVIDGLAGAGVRFVDATTPAPSTAAAHASVFTGMYPHHHGVANNFRALGAAAPTLAELLQDAGWWTAAAVGAQPLAPDSGLLRGFDVVDAQFEIALGDAHDQAQRRAPAVVDAALALAEQRPEGRPMLLFVHLYDAHFPYDGFEDLRGDLPSHVGSLRHVSAVRSVLAHDRQAGRAASDLLRRAYLAEIEGVDREVGRLLERLAGRRTEDPLVWVFADHGEAQDEHIEAWDHGFSVYQDTVHVPLIARLPGLAPQVFAPAVSLVDVLPTTLGWLDLPAVPSDGVDLTDALRGAADPPPGRELFTQATQPHRAGGDWPNAGNWAAVRTDGEKWMHDPQTGKSRLFAIAKDPEEAHDLTGQAPEAALRLRGSLDRWRAGGRPAPTTARGRQSASLLEALGYLEP